MSSRRFWKDLKDAVCSSELKECGIHFEPNESYIVELKIDGPPDSPYEGGCFDVQFNTPEEYPFVGPVVRFKTKVWHPNISLTSGLVCVDVLGASWSSSMTLSKVALYVQNLLRNPYPQDPLASEVGLQMIQNANIFQRTAQQWTAVYAGGHSRDDALTSAHQRLCDMGFSADVALRALSTGLWDEEGAVEALLNGAH